MASTIGLQHFAHLDEQGVATIVHLQQATGLPRVALTVACSVTEAREVGHLSKDGDVV